MSEDKGDKIIELKIDKLVAGGKGLGRYQNKVYFLKYTAPNEIVRAKVLKEKRDFGEARLLEVIIPSSQRTEPFVPTLGFAGVANSNIWNTVNSSAKRWKSLKSNWRG